MKKSETDIYGLMDYKTYSAAIVQSSDDAIYSKDLNGIISSWNKGARKIYGYTEKEIIGKSVSVLIPIQNHDDFPDILKKIRSGKDTDHYETERITKKGVIIIVSVSILSLRNKKGEIIGAVSIARDITDAKKSEKSFQYGRSLIEASLDPFITISPEGKITDVNQATINITGVNRTKLIGTDFSDYFTEPEKARLGYQEVLRSGLITDYPLTISHNLVEVLYNASVYKDVSGNVMGVFAAARDITAQRKAEAEDIEKKKKELIKIAEAEVAEQRKKELAKLAVLERFQKLTVGRELKMIELKDEIEELKVKLSKFSLSI